MQVEQVIWLNGKLVSCAQATVNVLSHSLHYGGGVLEGIRFYKTENGPAIFRLEEHVERLFYSTQVLKMTIPFSKTEISAAIQQVVAENGLEEGYIRPIIFYGHGKLTINPTGNPVECAIACWPWPQYFAHEQIDVKVSKYIRLHPESTVIEAKLCAHYLNGILASFELQDTPYHEILYLDYLGHVAEGMGANFFMVKSDVIYTPKIGSILIGITRNTIIDLARANDIEVIETDVSLENVYSADEAFFTGTAAEVSSLRSINQNKIGDGSIGKLTRFLKDTYHEIVHGRHADYLHYLTFVNKTNHNFLQKMNGEARESRATSSSSSAKAEDPGFQ